MSTKEILEQALKLKHEERFVLLEALIKSLESPDKKLDEAWAEEAGHRLRAYREGRLGSIPMEEIFNGLEQGEEALRESGESSHQKIQAILEPQGDIGVLSLGDIIDHQALQSMMDDFYRITKIPNAVVDLSGKTLVHAGWQDICVKLHRAHPDTMKNCHEEVTVLTNDVAAGTFRAHRCKNNLWSIVTPIEISGKHMGNIFIGQFFYEDETPDYDLFRRQALQYGFDEAEYIAALDRVPHLSRELVEATMGFYSKLAGMISTLSYSTIKLSRTLAECKQAEDELRIYKTISDNAVYGKAYSDLDGIILYVNKFFANIHGYDPEELVGQHLSIFHTEKQLEMVNEVNSRMLQDGSIEAQEIWHVHCNGTEFPMLMSSILLRDEYGNVQYMATSAVDITEHKKAEQETKEAQRRLLSVLDGMDYGVYVADMETYELLYLNKYLKKRWGDISGKKCWESIQAGQGGPCSFCTNDKLLDAGGMPTGVYQWEYFNARTNRWYECHDSAISWIDGRMVRIQALRDITERKLLEEALRESDRRYHELFEGSRDGCVVVDTKGRFLDANASYCSILGYSLDELKQKEDFYAITPERWRKWEHDEIWCNRLLKTGSSGVYEKEYIRKDGRVFPVELQSFAVLDEDGSFRYIWGIMRDITDRKQAEQALSDSEQRFRHIVEFSPLPLAILDGKGNCEYLNPQFTEIFGYTLADIPTGKRWFELAYPDPAYRQEVMAAWKSYQEELAKEELANNVAPPRSFTVTCKNGMNKETLFRTVVMDDGKYLVIYEDITERKQAEEALRESKERQSIILENINDTVWSYEMDSAGQLVSSYISPVGSKILGITEEELNHSFDIWFSFVLPEDLPPVKEAMAEAVTRGQGRPVDYRVKREDGSIRWVRSVGNLIKNQDGTMSLIGTGQDITERKQAEQKMADYTLELEQLYQYLDEEIKKARLIHERVLPKSFPVVPGISLASHYQPARNLGGDFYDVLRSGDKLIFYLSDVSGHGLDGAMISVFVKYTIKNYISLAPADGLTPAAIVSYLAEQFGREDYPEDMYVCLFMAVLDLGSMGLCYCGTGFQEKLLVQQGSGERLKLASKGMPITSYLPLEILQPQEGTITLTPGSTIFCNTDGLTEQESNGTYYRDRLPGAFFQNAHLPAHLVAQSVLEDFRHFNNGSQQGEDDITFLVLQVEKND